MLARTIPTFAALVLAAVSSAAGPAVRYLTDAKLYLPPVYYKRVRRSVQEGSLYRLLSPSADGAAVNEYRGRAGTAASAGRLRGLVPEGVLKARVEDLQEHVRVLEERLSA